MVMKKTEGEILMKKETRSRIELFVTNTQSLRGKFIWQNLLLKRLAAMLYAAEDKVIDDAAIQESYDLIKKSTGIFSSFRGNSAMTISTLLSLNEDRQKQLNDTLTIYRMLKANKFWTSDFLVVAAYQIAANINQENYSRTAQRAKAFYDGMKAQHFFITGPNDYIFAVMLGISDIEIAEGLKQMEQLYKDLKPEFRSANGVQALTHVLVLSGENKDIANRVISLAKKFRQRGMRLDKEYTLSELGVLSLLPADIDDLVDDVIEAYELLRNKKGFGRWSVTKQELLLFSSSLIAMEYIDKAKKDVLSTAIYTSLTNIIVAQQTAIAVAASSSAAVASS